MFARPMEESYSLLRISQRKPEKFITSARAGLSGKYQEVYDLEAIDGDQGKYLISSYPLAVSHVKP